MAKKESKRLTAIEKRIAAISDYKRTFSSEQGKRVLQDLMQAHYLMRPTLRKGNDLALNMAFNEGQRNVVLRILTILETSEASLHTLLKETHNVHTENTQQRSSFDGT